MSDTPCCKGFQARTAQGLYFSPSQRPTQLGRAFVVYGAVRCATTYAQKSGMAQDCTLANSKDRAAASGAHINTQKMADQVAHGEKSLPEAVEELTGKRPGAKKPTTTPAPTEAPYDPREDEAAEMAHTVRRLAAENDALKDRIAVEVMPA